MTFIWNFATSYLWMCILPYQTSYVYMNFGTKIFWWLGYTTASMGLGNGRDCSALEAMSTWWIPHLQCWKPVIPLGQCRPSWYLTTRPKYAGCSKNLSAGCSPRAYWATFWLDIYPGICTYCLPGGAHQSLDETWQCQHRESAKQLWNLISYQSQGEAFTFKQAQQF